MYGEIIPVIREVTKKVQPQQTKNYDKLIK